MGWFRGLFRGPSCWIPAPVRFHGTRQSRLHIRFIPRLHHLQQSQRLGRLPHFHRLRHNLLRHHPRSLLLEREQLLPAKPTRALGLV